MGLRSVERLFMLPAVMDVSVISLDEDPSWSRDPSNERRRRVKIDILKKDPEFNSKAASVNPWGKSSFV